MLLLIFLGILTVVMLVLIGIVIAGFLDVPMEIRGSFRWLDLLLVAVYAVCVLLMGGLFCFTLSEYVASHIGYSSSEYQIEKKVIVSSVENCTDKADTLYLFKRK